MEHKNFGHLDGQQIIDSMVKELAKVKAELKQEGQAAGEAVGRGWDEGLDSTVNKIKASSIKMEKAFNDLSGKIRKQVQQLTTSVNGKDFKLKIDFSNIDMNSDAIKQKVANIVKNFSTEGLIEFDAKGSEQQFKNLITLYVKYQEKLNSLQKTSPNLSSSKDIEGNLQQQLVLASKLKEIWSFLDYASPLKGYDVEIKNIRAQLEAVQKITGQTQGGDTKVAGDYKELSKVLKEIQGSLKIISDTFTNENNSMKAMAENGKTSFKSLSQAIIEVYNNLTQVQSLVDTISKKDFNITNITQTGGGDNGLQAMTKQMAVARETMEHLRQLYDQAGNTLQGLAKKGQVDAVFEYQKQLQELDLTAIGKSIKGANTEMKLASVLAEMQDYIDKLIQINELRNKFGLGEWKDTFVPTQQPATKPVVTKVDTKATTTVVEKPQEVASLGNTEAQHMWQLKAAIDEVSNAIGRKNAGFIQEKEIVEMSVESEKAKLKELVAVIINEIGSALDGIKEKFAQSFMVPEFDKTNLKGSLDDVYNTFIELKSKIETIKIDIGANTVNTIPISDSASNTEQAVGRESQSATDAAKSFIDAANAKKQFVEANKQVAETAKTSEDAVKKEAEAAKIVAADVGNVASKVAKDLAKTKEIFNNDGELIQTDTTRKFKTDKAYVSETDSTRIMRDADGNEASTTITTIVKDFEKLTKEADKSKEAVTRAQNKLNEFLTRFQSKSGGNAKFISGFNELKGTTVTSDNIEETFNKMMALQAEYSKLETNFRKGQSSLNPFVNAITKSENIGNIFGDVERQFNGLTNKSDELVNNFTKLQDLSQKIQAFTQKMNNTPNAITPKDFSEFSEQVGKFNVLKSQVEGSIKAESLIEAEGEQKRKKEVEDYINLVKQKNEYEAKAAKGGAMQSAYEAKVVELQGRMIANDKQSIMNQEEKNRLLTIETAHQEKIAEINSKKNLFATQNGKLQDKFNAGYLSNANFSNWQNELATYQSYLNGTIAADEGTIQKKKASLTQLYDHLNKISNASRTFFASGGEILSTWFNPEQIQNVSGSLRGLYDSVVAERFNGMKTSVTGVNETLGRLTFTVDDGRGSLTQYTIAMDKASGATKLLIGNTKGTMSVVQQFSKALKGDAITLSRAFIGGMSGMYAVGRYIRQGIQYVRELDKALTELKKVTDETEETYDKFLVTAGKTSSRIGSTLSNMTSATAEFAKLGYDIEQASKMAESALVYTNVGDNVDVETGSQSIISTMKAFGIEANNTMSIVDKFNEIGNNFAITTKGIGDALQVSASAMAAAGNTLDETIALITAAM